MSNFDILDAWSEFSEYDPDQTLFTIGTISEYTNKNINDGGYIL